MTHDYDIAREKLRKLERVTDWNLKVSGRADAPDRWTCTLFVYGQGFERSAETASAAVACALDVLCSYESTLKVVASEELG